MDIRKVVGRNIRRLRVLQDLSQEKLAVDADIDRTHVSRIERGIENPTVLVLDRIAGALDVDICELLVKPAPGSPPPKPLRSGRRPGK